jgi:Domain of unknown function (DUF4439)
VTPLESLQAALAGEHAAIFAYGVLGGRLAASQAPSTEAALTSAYAVHRSRRDQLHQMVRALGGQPVAAAPAYDVEGPAQTAPQIVRKARELESRCAEVYAQAVGSTVGAPRKWAVDALTDAAVRGLWFGATPQAFPGLAELA